MSKLWKLRIALTLFLFYCDPFPRHQRRLIAKLSLMLGPTASADAIFVQAYGRINMLDSEMVEYLGPAMAETDLCRSMELLERIRIRGQKIGPCLSNEDLARESRQLMEGNDRLLIAQWEVVYALFLADKVWFSANLDKIVCLWPKVGELKQNWLVRLLSRYMPMLRNDGKSYRTIEVKRDSIIEMQAHGRSKPIEVSHQNMAVRAVVIIWQFGIYPTLHDCFIRDDEKSSQDWTRNDQLWIKKEIPGRVFHILAGWVSFWPPSKGGKNN